MKVSHTSFLILLFKGTSAFVTQFSSRPSLAVPRLAQNDDWWDGYDEQKYEPKVKGYEDDSYKGRGDSRSYGREASRGTGRSSFGGRNSEYTRDTSRDVSNVDEGAIMELLRQRGEAKKNRDFDKADAIREDLLINFSVAVDDRERMWRTGASASGSGRMFGGKDRSPRKERKPRNFGPNGHDYYLSEDAGPNASSMSDEQIHKLLAERLQAKMSRTFDIADKIQMQLIDSGVYVHDALKEWRADGIPYGDLDGGGRPGKVLGSRSFRDMSYTRSEYSMDLDVSDELIDGLVAERFKCKSNREYDKADAIREGLRTRYNVLIDDRLRQWSVGGDFGEEHNIQRELADKFANRGYIQSQSSADFLSDDDKVTIEKLIDDRNAAKKDRDFATADAIRDELFAKYDVTINDKLKLWSVGGYFEELGGKARNPRGVYTRRGGGDLSEEDIKYVEDMLAQRYQAKKNRDFNTADSIRDALRAEYNISIDDSSSVWCVESGDYAQVGDVKLSQSDLDHINMELRKRFECKLSRDYEGADAIRESLAEKFGVAIDDRNKEWKVERVQSDVDSYYSEASDDLDAQLDMVLDDVLNEDETNLVLVEEVENEEKPSSSDVSEEDLSSLTVPLLKEKLKSMGLPVSGTKAVLIQRILDNN
jgi:cysteinyl-tRNA synthetase